MTVAVLMAAVAAWASCPEPDPDECMSILHARPALETIATESKRAHLDPLLVLSVAAAESGFRSDLKGASGELGMFQLRRGTGGPIPQDMKPDEVAKPDVNAKLAIRYIARMRDICGSDPHQFLSCYNGRPPRASSYSRKVLRIHRGILAAMKDGGKRNDPDNVDRPGPDDCRDSCRRPIDPLQR